MKYIIYENNNKKTACGNSILRTKSFKSNDQYCFTYSFIYYLSYTFDKIEYQFQDCDNRIQKYVESVCKIYLDII
jgi:hypothetical protein